MLQETVETSEEDTSADDGDPEVEEELSPTDAAAKSSITTSGEVEVAPTKVTTNSDADVGILAAELKVEMIEESPVREQAVLQGSSNQPGAADAVKEPGSGFLGHNKLFHKNTVTMNQIV